MKTKDKIRNNKDKDKKIILWEVKSFQAIEINKREEEFKDVSMFKGDGRGNRFFQ